MPRRDPTILLCGLVLVVAAAVIYAPSLSVPFFFDDVGSITENPHVRSLLPLGAALRTPDETTVAGRPVVALSLAINHALGGYAVAGYHVWNVACHAACALLLLGLVRRTLLTPRLRASHGAAATSLGFAVALLWTAHPLQTEAVSWVIQRTEVMVSLFYLGVLYALARACDDGEPDARRWTLLAAACCWLGMGTKEVMVSAPLAALLWDRTFAAGTFAEALRRRRGLYTSLAASWALLAVLVASGPRGDSVGFHHGISAWQCLLTQSEVIAWYLRLAAWPAPLSVWYDWPVVTSLADAWPTVLLVGGLLALSAWALVRRSALALPACGFFLVLAPSSSFVPVATELAAERRMYLPLAAVVTLAVLGAHALMRRTGRAGGRLPGAAREHEPGVHAGRRLRIAGALVLASLAGASGTAAARRVSVYQDLLGLWTDTVVKQPHSHQARFNLGLALQRAGRPAEALAQYDKALALDPHAVPLLVNYGIVLGQLGEHERAVTFYEHALTTAPHEPLLHHNLGLALVAVGRDGDALACFRRAVELRPDFADAHSNLAVLCFAAGDIDAAGLHLAHALHNAPEHPQALALLEMLKGA